MSTGLIAFCKQIRQQETKWLLSKTVNPTDTSQIAEKRNLGFRRRGVDLGLDGLTDKSLKNLDWDWTGLGLKTWTGTEVSGTEM